MDFRLSDEQEMFRKSVRDYVNRELPKSWARDLEKDEHAFPHELFGKLAAAGFHGGMGYSAETDMQRYWRDSRLFRIGPITNEMARNSIAEGLGLPRSF
jgi:alkylation response protein AidB-like acyl-CoA dehydrogenase